MSLLSTLEPRYIRILKLVAGGLSSKEIAQRLELSPRSVDTYVKEIKHAFVNEPEAHGRLPNRAALTRIYQRLNNMQTSTGETLDRSRFQDASHDQQLVLARLLSEAAMNSLSSGIPRVTAHIAASACREVESIIQQLPKHSDYRDEFLDVLIQLLVQQGWAYSQLSSLRTNWSFDTGFYDYLRHVADQYQQSGLEILAEFFLADGYSIALDQDNAVRTLQHALLAAQEVNHKWLNKGLFLGLVKLAGTWADRAEQQEAAGGDIISEQREFWTVAGQIEEALGIEGQIEVGDIAYAYERLAAATAALRLPIARDYLGKARHYTMLNSQSEHPFRIREAQLVDTELAVRQGLDPGSSLLDLEAMANRGVEQAMTIGCTRLAQRICSRFG